MEKSPDAFRTISEVADWLDVPTHVLRFWESRFAQVKPVKRAGGRRYYRPSDMRLIGGIKKLLHDDGMTIRGVQKLLREEGVKHVSGFSQPLEHERADAVELPVSERTVLVEAAHDELETGIPEPEVLTAATADPVEQEAELPPAPVDEELADAEWTAEAEQTAGWDEETETPVPDDSDPSAIPPAPTEAQVMAFGSVRSKSPDSELTPLTPGSKTESPQTADVPELVDEDTMDLGPGATGIPPAPEEPAALPPHATEEERRPIVANVPDQDPMDDATSHSQSPGAAARLLLLERSMLADDSIRIEQVVAALRAVRDRSTT